MFHLDLFDFFRYVLAWVVGIYATVVSVQSLWTWYVYLAGSDKYIGLVRRYLIVHGLRLRFRAFWADVVVCLLLTGAFGLIWQAHRRMDALKVSLDQLRRVDPAPVRRVASKPLARPAP